MRTDQVDALVASLIVPNDDLVITRSSRGDVVEVRVSPAREGAPRRHALITTPGDWWVSLRVDGGYADSIPVREPDAVELSAHVGRYLRAAEHYVRSGGVPTRAGRMRWPALRVGGSEPVVLPRIVGEQVRSVLRSRPSTGGRAWF